VESSGLTPAKLDALWTTGVIERGVRSMKNLGELLAQEEQDKEVIYVFLVDGRLDWFKAWLNKRKGTQSVNVFEYLESAEVNILYGRWRKERYLELYEGVRKELEQVKKENEKLKTGGAGLGRLVGWWW